MGLDRRSVLLIECTYNTIRLVFRGLQMDRGQTATDAPAPRRCAWSRCRRDATIQVLAGDLLRRRRRHHGFFCAAHSVEASSSLRARAAVDVWFAVLDADQRHRVEMSSGGMAAASRGMVIRT